MRTRFLFTPKDCRGMTLPELLVVVALTTLIFGALMVSFQFMLNLIGSSKAYAGALALANEKMEYIRSLEYTDIGTVSGIPSGPVPQNSSTTLNGIDYAERVLIEYVDAVEDGEGGDDINGILADYKRVKVEYSWEEDGDAKIISLISNIVPEGIETTDGGGTLTVNVFDAQVQPLSGAEVHLFNDTGTSTIDITRSTNANGVAMFSGAPALANYEITVTDTGYSTDQTYSATTSNPNPITPHVAVLEAEVSTMNFQIDELGDLTVRTIGEPTTDSFEDFFDDETQVSAATSTAIAGGAATLEGAPGSYVASGSLYSIAITPAVVDSWDTAYFEGAIPTNTTLIVRVYDATSSTTPLLIPDGDLPGNSAGFAPGNIDLSSVDPATYSSLSLGAFLTSSDTATTSELFEWTISYTVSEPPLPSIPFTITGAKTIGTTASSAAIYKYDEAFVTYGTGDVDINDLEWDVYAIVVTDGSYDVAEACQNIPYSLDPGVSETLTLTLSPAVSHSLRVRVEDIDGNPIANADVDLTRSGFSDSLTSSVCGGAFFNDSISTASDYDLSISASGYVTQTVSDFTISGATTQVVTLSSS